MAPDVPPTGRIDDVWIRGIDVDIVAAGVLVLVEDFFERSAAVGRTEDASLFIGPVGMPECGNEQPRSDCADPPQCSGSAAHPEAQMRPRPAGIR